MEVTLAAPAVVAGEHVSACITGAGAFGWRMSWRARGGQRETDHVEVVAAGRGVATASGTPVDALVPVGAPPSYAGTLVEVRWILVVTPEGTETGINTTFQVRAGPAPRRLGPWITAWKRQERAIERAYAGAVVFYVLIGIGVFVAACILAVGAVLFPPAQALLLLGMLALAGVGAAATLRESLPGWAADRRARAHLRVTPGPFGVPGGEIEVAIAVDRRRAAAAGGLSWTLRCIERTATCVTWNDRGRPSERYEWAVHTVLVREGELRGPPYGARRIEVPLPAEAPPTLACDHRTLSWQLDVRCGEDVVEAVFFVAPFAA
jgi:hypothetical protein